MRDPTMEEQGRMVAGAQVATILPIVEEEIAKMKQGIQNRVNRKIANGEMTPEYADSAWRDISAMDRLLQRIRTHVIIGAEIGESLNEDGDK